MAALTMSDRKLLQAVLDEIRWDLDVGTAPIRVEVDGDVVILRGTVDSYEKKWAAEQAVRRVPGVRTIVNDIEVKPRDAVDDADLARAINEALERNPLVPHERITVTVRDGWVTLEGEVDYGFEREEAERTVRQIPGVVSVVDLITVKPVPDDDAAREIAHTIKRAFVLAAEDDADRIDVKVAGGHVTLTGRVRSTFERMEAERAAWRAPGVIAVENRIMVRVD